MLFTLQVRIMQIVKICELACCGGCVDRSRALAFAPAVSQPGRVSAQLNILAA
jgi:hypothetical protein